MSWIGLDRFELWDEDAVIKHKAQSKKMLLFPGDY